MQYLHSWCLMLTLIFAASGGNAAAVNVCSTSNDDSMDSMDLAKSPCENFYDYACDNWHASYSLRALGAHDMRTKVRASNKKLLVQHFEASGAAGTKDQLSSFYDSCMNGRQSLRVYIDAVQKVMPNWPLLNNDTTGFDWARGNAAVRRFGVQGLWRLLIQANWQAGEQQIFYLLEPSFELLGSNEESEFLYERYLKYLLLELGLRVRRAAKLAKQLVSFERQLRELTTPLSAVLHAPQTLEQLNAQLPQLQLLEYFRMLLGSDYTPQLLLVADTEYLKRLQRLLHSTPTDPLILSSWLLLQLPAHFELLLHEDTTLAAQREHCLQQLNHLLPQQLSQLQLRLWQRSSSDEIATAAAAEQFLKETQEKLQQLFGTLRQQFERLLNATPVFQNDADTQTLALQKLRAMQLILPQLKIDEQQHPPPQGASYDENLLQLSQSQSLAQFRLALFCLQLPCESQSQWTSQSLGPLDVNVYYRLKLNAIELPLGLMQAASNRCATNATLLGSFGYMLGHEMLHAFDYDGINYDATGRVADTQWPARTIIRFGLRARCYLGSRYSNATLTINENIADSEGLRLAYEALQRQPALDNATIRSFFVAFAQNWCGHATAAPSSGQQHASHQDRVNNVLGNFPEFSEAFGCKAGSLMDPLNKCRLW